MLQAGFGPERVESGARTRAHSESFAKWKGFAVNFARSAVECDGPSHPFHCLNVAAL